MTRADINEEKAQRELTVGHTQEEKNAPRFSVFHLSDYTFLVIPLELRVVNLSQILCHMSANVEFTAIATT